MRASWIYYLPALAWAILILALSGSAPIKVPEPLTEFFTWDKLGHAFFYAVFSGLIVHALSKSGIEKKKWWLAVLLSAFYGGLMEGLQYTFFPERYFEMWDIVANIIGSFGGFFIYLFIFK